MFCPEGRLDWRIHPQPPGWSSDSNPTDAGVDYLRRLKGATVPTKTEVRNDGKTAAPKTVTDNEWKERRQSPRLRCSGSAEFRTADSDLRMWGTLTDISLHGCYVEMNATFPVNTKVELVLKSYGIRIEVSGTVRASYPFLGMGIGFGQIEAEQQTHLKELLAALGGQSAFFRGRAGRENAPADSLRVADPRAVLDEVAQFFRKNQNLSREEFHQIAQRVRRS